MPPVPCGPLYSLLQFIGLIGPTPIDLYFLPLRINLVCQLMTKPVLAVPDGLHLGHLLLVIIEGLAELYFGLAGLHDLLLESVDLLPEGALGAGFAQLGEARRQRLLFGFALQLRQLAQP